MACQSPHSYCGNSALNVSSSCFVHTNRICRMLSFNANDRYRGLEPERHAIGRFMCGIGHRSSIGMLIMLSCAACDDHDIGQPCLELLNGTEPSPEPTGGQVVTEEVVEQNPAFPCDEMICVASAGRAGYCTKKCRSDSGCPAGFECRTVQKVGPFAEQGFCVWKACTRRSDCGDGRYCCVVVPEADPSKQATYCDFSDGGDCS